MSTGCGTWPTLPVLRYVPVCEERGVGWGCEYWVWYMSNTASPKVGVSVYKGWGGEGGGVVSWNH